MGSPGSEHVGGAVSIVGSITSSHHGLPTLRDTTVAKGREAEEEYQERTNNKNRCLNRRERHHTLHSTKHGEDGGDGNEANSTIPEGDAEQVLEEDTTREGRHRNLSEHVGNQSDDRQPRTRALGVTELQEVGHGDDLAHLVD